MSSSEQESYAQNRLRAAELEARKTRVRQLNDLLRQCFIGGLVMVTPGLRELDPAVLSKILQGVQSFDSFTPDNDPYGEHDFGCVEESGHCVYWKIDCYDKQLEYGSPDPSDSRVTMRVITIMLAAEY